MAGIALSSLGGLTLQAASMQHQWAQMGAGSVLVRQGDPPDRDTVRGSRLPGRSMPTGIELSLAGVLAAFAVLGLWSLRRPGLGPTPFWIAGWLAAGVSGILMIAAPGLSGLNLLIYPLGTAFPFLLLAGALELAGRRQPSWLLPAALLLGLTRSTLAALGNAPAAYGLALAVEPAVTLTAAWVLHHAVSGPAAGLPQRLLAPSFVILAIAGALHVLWLMLGRGPDLTLIATWLVVTPPVLGLQIYAVSDRNRRALHRAQEHLERQVAVRTRELAEANSAQEPARSAIASCLSSRRISASRFAWTEA